MEPRSTAPDVLEPVAAAARIEALDVVRGFALLGILWMNIEFFNRSSHGIEEGMPHGLTGLDWVASWFVAYFIQGKFWTLFSLLFGMGFAVMLARAEHMQRNFLVTYLRRIGALAVIGAAHYVFLWEGDILFSYAVAAGALLILLYGAWKHILASLLLLVGMALIPDLRALWAAVGALVWLSLNALYLRSERRFRIRRFSWPLFSFLVMVLGVLALIAAAVLWLLPDGPKEPRVPVTLAAILLIVSALLSAKFREPALRELRLGVALWIFGAVMMIGVGAAHYFSTAEPATAPDATKAVVATSTSPTPAKPKTADKPAPTDVEKAAAERAKKRAKQQEDVRNEERILSRGGYGDAVELRASKFPMKAVADAGFSTVLLSMFLIGAWFVRSGVMRDTLAHLALFRKLALVGLPVGIGLGLLGSLIAMSQTPGDEHDGFMMARGLSVLGNLPACLGYLGLVVCLLHSQSVFARIRVLAPFGRMALTHYLLQSVVCAFTFFGHGLGLWGMSRAWQLVFATVLLVLQIAASHWWLARYRFGPMEWLWRGFTYRRTPPMRM